MASYSAPMPRTELKRLIAEALAQPRGRDALFALLNGIDAAELDGELPSVEAPPLAEAGVSVPPPLYDAGLTVPPPDPADLAESPTSISSTSSWIMLPALSAEDIASTSDSLETMLNAVNDAIVAVDVEARILSANVSAGRLFGDSVEGLLGRSIEAFLPALCTGGVTLQSLAEQHDHDDASPELVQASRVGGELFTAELTISKLEQEDQVCFILCVRDVTERLQNLQALRDSEARYRALVENAPEAIVVLDVDENRFVDANDNAVKLFKFTRKELLSLDLSAISPDRQSDGLASLSAQRGYIDRALKGGRPVFEWLHCDAAGREIPCEVRFIRLPSSKRRLVRASIMDVAARRRADTLAYGERKLLELIVSNVPLERVMRAAVRLAEQMHDDVRVALMRLDDRSKTLRLAVCGRIRGTFREALRELPVGSRFGPCSAAASLGRQVVVTEIALDGMCAEISDVAAEHGVRAACSTPIITTGNRIHGTLACYFDSPRSPTIEELDLISRLTQIVGIAIRRRQDEAALRESEARFRALFDNVVDGVFQMSLDGELTSANPALLNMLGFDDIHELAEHRWSDLCVNVKDYERLVTELRAHGRVRNYEYRLKRRNGSSMVVVENSRVVKDAAGRALYCEGTITDITQRKAAERELFEEKERAQVTLKSIGDAVVTTDAHGRVDYMNPVAEQLTGWERRLAYRQDIGKVIKLKSDAGEEIAESPVLRCLREGRAVTLGGHAVLVGRDGACIAIQDSAAPIQDGDGNVVGAVLVFHDVSQERQLHRKLSYYATHDSLTGLINRREFEERLSNALQAIKLEDQHDYALLYMDLDQFKVVNDTCGHAAGDLLLRQVAELIQSRVRATDIVARLGGDEFALLLSDCSMKQATEVADLLREAVAEFRFSWQDSSMQVGVSIGIVPVAPESKSIGELFSAADVACYVAKDLGRNRYHVYEEGDAAERHQEMQWVARINRAREEERFELYFQPIVPIGRVQNELRQFELLLRMRDEHGQIVAPNTFIPAAERYNLMPSLDRWVVDEVLDSLVYREGMACSPYMLAINLSGTTLNDARFLDYLLKELSTSHIPAGALCFEITETAAIANLERVVQFMRALKSRGCRFSLDDFGTGLSSLTYLKNLPVDYVKIDGQFIRNVTKDAADECVVESIARMAAAFRIHTIAERVESREALVRLGEIGITFAQGFFIAVPQPVADLPIHAVPKRLQA